MAKVRRWRYSRLTGNVSFQILNFFTEGLYDCVEGSMLVTLQGE